MSQSESDWPAMWPILLFVAFAAASLLIYWPALQGPLLGEKDPEFYVKRLKGSIPNAGVLDHDGCCIRPSGER